jgi:hypothetical protein
MTCVAYVVDIARSYAFLNVGKSSSTGVLFAQKIGNEGVHTCGCEKYGRIVVGDKGRRRNYGVTFVLEKS